MKIIQIVGRSNSGKTSFIKELIPALNGVGRTGVIKHLGDHEYVLEEGKDTTGFFETGANISVGIDANKSVIALRNNSLDDTLLLLFRLGIDFVILEGFKSRSFPKIVIGDLSIENCVLRNPSVHEVIASFNKFEDFIR